MDKYVNLNAFLKFQKAKEVTLSFSKIEEIIENTLPDSASKYPAWWANDMGSAGRQCKAWLENGWKTIDVKLGESVTFVKE